MAQQRRSLIPRLAALTVILVLAACSAARPRPNAQPLGSPNAPATPQSANPPPGAIPTPRPPSPPRENHLSPATSALVTQSKNLLNHGDLDGASSTLDRALRIEPNNPLLWIELGRLRLAENDAHQAEGCGRKALALASGDHVTQRQAGKLLSDALRAQQRNQEAQAVESQPYMQLR
jgi:tetratricopeptide (TPR) repeat protein